ncbi:ErmE/ErmH/ErmO/ErmR family 23S rRNA (adenine(2058)-N(6))-methyltransferase [Nonomuraea sp. NPDC050328]|uniref:ErmE/ErmH/ErmO/ErmR family 23S rRNA (adenine(2058)-N(6))-methyltransferase n=1 Tax=Nonomuraea sp. NPDC050328 TaxID=3364361 RepID=UPI003795D664
MAQSYAFGNYSHTQQKTTRTSGGRTPRDRARRELSQNFLTDPQAIEQIVKVAAPAGLILEPGPGEGALTFALAAAGAQVIGYEADPLYAAKLKARTRDNPRIQVVKADFTTVRPPAEPFAVAGNIPFSITSPIVRWCLNADRLTSATLLTQLEYARKRSGDFGRWSRLTVSAWPWFGWELTGRIGRESFRPVPSVDSGVLRIERRAEPLVSRADEAAYTELVELGFTGVGGTLHATLRGHHPGLDAAFAVAGIPRDAVVAFVHPDQWVALFHALHR